MARIPDTEIERLKREVSLPRVLEAQGLALVKQGKDLACRCPWHAGDDTPSCDTDRKKERLRRVSNRRLRRRCVLGI